MNGRLHPWFLTFTCATALLAAGGFLSAREPAPQATAGQAQITASKADSAPVPHWIPFSADEIRETTQTLADGTHVTHRMLTRIFRDSEGRERIERYVTQGGSSQAQNVLPWSIDILDRVAGVRYSLDTRDHTARRFTLPQPSARPTPQKRVTPPAASAERPKSSVEDLGEQEIEGVTVQGQRITRTIPAEAEGNDTPIVVTEEQWSSGELHRMVLENVHDPRFGETTIRLTNISREEPSPELFQIPADYTLVEEQPVRAGIAPAE